jgi:AcrR family transcriptional regulator
MVFTTVFTFWKRIGLSWHTDTEYPDTYTVGRGVVIVAVVRQEVRTRLDRRSIVTAGLELAAQPGATKISVRDLGARLGADPTALYRHFSGKRQLMEALLDELLIRVLDVAGSADGDWRARCRLFATETIRVFRAYPAIAVEGVVLTTHGRGEADTIEFLLSAFAEGGLDGDDLVRHYSLLSSHVLAHAAGAASARIAALGEVPPQNLWLEGPLHPNAEGRPLLGQVRDKLIRLTDDEIFLFGVDLIIQSAERTAAVSTSD